MHPLLIALLTGVAYLIAYNTYGRWLGRRIFKLSAHAVCPSVKINDGKDYVPTAKSVVFGHHFASIAGTGPIVGPAIAIMWGWLPGLLWVIFGCIFIGAVHDFGSLVVSLRSNGQTVGDIAGRVMNRRVRLLFLLVLFMALTIVLAIFGLVIAAVFRQYPAAIFPCMVQIPIAVVIGFWIYGKGGKLLVPSIIALALMYLTVIYGDVGILDKINTTMAGWSNWTWVVILLIYCYIASVLPVWILLQPRDYINSLQLISSLGLVLVGLVVAAFVGGAPPVAGAARPTLAFVAPMINWHPVSAPLIVPFLFITIACGAISGFHCLVSSGTSSKQLRSEPDARFVGYGGMLMEGFLATLVILACGAGLGLGLPLTGKLPGGTVAVATAQGRTAALGFHTVTGASAQAVFSGDKVKIVEGTTTSGMAGGISRSRLEHPFHDRSGAWIDAGGQGIVLVDSAAWNTRYHSWSAAGSFAAKVGAFVDGAGNFLKAMGIPGGVAMALMGVLVASFAGTTLDTACRLQRYVVQELASCLLRYGPRDSQGHADDSALGEAPAADTTKWRLALNPLVWLRNMHGATIFAVSIAAVMAAIPLPGKSWSWANTGSGGMILWPLFGATNQLLGGLAFMVILFYLWRRGKPIWFIVLPMIFMLIIPAWAMGEQLVVDWWPHQRYVLVGIAVATLALEIWMVMEGLLMFPKVRGVLERAVEEPQASRGFAAVSPVAVD